MVEVTTVPSGSTFQSMTVASGVRASALRTPNKTAVIDGDRCIAFNDLVERMDRLSSVVSGELGLGRGDHAAILSPNCIEYFEVVLGLAQIGVAAVHISGKASTNEIRFMCSDAQTRVLFVHESLRSLVDAIDLPSVERVVVLGSSDYEDWLAQGHRGAPKSDVAEWETFSIFYTSGTTGKPKAVLVPHRSRVLNFLGMAAEYGCYSPNDHSLAIAPMSHGAGLSFSLAPIFFGGTTTVHRAFDPEAVIAELATSRITNIFVVPTHMQAIFALPPERRGSRPPTLRRIISNAAPLPYKLKELIVEHFGPDVLFECYGSTEAGIVSNLAPEDQLRKPGSVGRPFPLTSVRILDEAGVDVAEGEVGELYSSSPALFNGYLHMPLATTPGLRDGWFSAGDLAKRDSEHYLYIVGRRDDKIITGGLNVYPREVEDALMSHPAVEEAAVFGLPDERWGEAVHAVVTLKDGKTVSTEALTEHCRSHLARYKVPKGITVLHQLPKNAAGKVVRRELPNLTASTALDHE